MAALLPAVPVNGALGSGDEALLERLSSGMGTFSVRAWRDGLLGAAGGVFGEEDIVGLIEEF
jgi:hypothetical protein